MIEKAAACSPVHSVELGAALVLAACHDFAGPLATAALGLDLLGEQGDEETRDEGLSIVREGLRGLSARLAFLRAAFSGGEAPVAAGTVEAAARGLFEGGKATLVLRAAPVEMPAPAARLLLHLAHLGLASLPNGGVVTLAATRGRLEALAAGRGARLSPAAAAGLALAVAPPGPAADWTRGVCVASAASTMASKVRAETAANQVRFLVKPAAAVPRTTP